MTARDAQHAAPDQARLRRVAAQHLRTLRLLGVDIVPRRDATSPIFQRGDADAMRSAPDGEIEAKPAAVDAAPLVEASAPARPAQGDKAERLRELAERYARESTVAASIEGWTNVVFGDGSPDARLMFVGEAPGADEDAQGKPFVGRAGQKLNEMIRAMGLTRETVYIANVLKVRPPNNRTPTPAEAQADGPFLEEQIDIIRPAVIVTLGRPAAQYLLRSTDSMGALRGTWHAFTTPSGVDIPVMPTYHPAFLLRAYTPENRRKVWSDLQHAMGRLG
jgi:DNA polymerase